MNIGWVIKGHMYGFQARAPKVTDTLYALEYIWIDKHADIAYILTALEDGHATWSERSPDYIINVNTDNPVYFIGETYLGDQEHGIPIEGPKGDKGDKGDDGDDGDGIVPFVGPNPPPNPEDGMLWWDTDDPGVSDMNEALVMYKDGTISYVCKAAIGSERTDPVWQISKIDSNAAELGIIWCDGDELYDNLATSLAVVELLNFT